MKIEYPIRLQSYLSKCGVGSRRGCETLITEGRVMVNNKIVMELGTKVNEFATFLHHTLPTRNQFIVRTLISLLDSLNLTAEIIIALHKVA